MSSILRPNVRPSGARLDAMSLPPPHSGSASTSRFPTTRFSPTYDSGHGASNTVPLQSIVKTSDIVKQVDCEAHQAQLSSCAQILQLLY